ncbi:ABC transporter ATP-binding protein [Candidatus Riflebacteria bacterium]
MYLKHLLPLSIRQSLAKQTGTHKSVQYVVKSDLTLDRQFGISYLIVTKKHVVIADKKSVVTVLPLAKICKTRIDELFGCSVLVAVLGDCEKRLAYYSKSLVSEFGDICRVINDLKRSKTPELKDLGGELECPRCGSPLAEKDASCPACVPCFTIMKRLLGLLKPYRQKAGLVVLATLVSVAAQMCPPIITKQIVDGVLKTRDTSALGFWILGMLCCGLVYLGARYTAGTLSSWMSARLIADLRSRLNSHLQRLQMSYYNHREDGEIVSRVMYDTSELQHFLIDGLPQLFVNVLTFFAIGIILLYLDYRLALVVFLPVPFLLFGVKWFWDKLIPLFHRSGSRTGGLYSILGESIKGIKTVKAASDERGRIRRFDRTNRSLFQTVVCIEQTFVGFCEVTFWIMSLGLTGVWFFASLRIAAGDPNLSLGTLLAFVSYIALFYAPMQWFTVIINWMSHAFAGAERIFAVLDITPETYDHTDAVKLDKIQGRINFEDIHFSYEGGKEVLKGLNFKVKAGEMIGLVGKSGAGKSTIINLLCNFYQADSGVIRIDGYPIDRLRLSDLRNNIGIVMQEPFLFRASILENIRYGTPEASFAEVVKAARAAHAHDFIVDKEHGYDTGIGEGGLKLSGGEKQRIAIARAILADPPILILDEATSSVDCETEKAIQEATALLVKNRTTIAIAHRLGTLRNADRLVVVDEGRIVEQGSHDELLEQKGVYARLVQTQTELSKLRSKVIGD